MVIKQYLEQAIRGIESEKERAINVAKEKVTREKVIPYNNEINISRDNAIKELTETLNKNIADLQQKYAIDKQALIDIGEKKKTEFANSVIEAEISVVSLTCDQAISELKAQIEKIKE